MQFFDDGFKSLDGYFKQGLKQGVHTVYFPNGKVLSNEEYDNGNKTGHWNLL
jgi:antitoxin component YwqK of YwqJK toxin-antitoxin module